MTTTVVSDRIDPQQSNALFRDANWQACFEAFLQDIYKHSSSIPSYVNYRSTLRNFFRRDPERDPASYGRRDVQEYIARTSTSKRNFGKPISGSTANFSITCLTSFYKFACGWELTPGQFLFTKALPTWGMRSRKRSSIESRAMSPAELEALFTSIDRSSVIGKRDFALLCLALLTCRRKSEITRLRWSAIEQTTIVDKDGTRRPGVVYRFTEKGNALAERTLELPETAYVCLLDYLRASGRLESMRPDSPLFTGINQGQWRKGKGSIIEAPLTPSAFTAIFKQRLALAHIDPAKWGVHALRHSGAHSRWIAGAGDLFDIQHTLGHKSAVTTQIYLNGMSGVSDKASQKVVAALPFLASPAREAATVP